MAKINIHIIISRKVFGMNKRKLNNNFTYIFYSNLYYFFLEFVIKNSPNILKGLFGLYSANMFKPYYKTLVILLSKYSPI